MRIAGSGGDVAGTAVRCGTGGNKDRNGSVPRLGVGGMTCSPCYHIRAMIINETNAQIPTVKYQGVLPISCAIAAENAQAEGIANICEAINFPFIYLPPLVLIPDKVFGYNSLLSRVPRLLNIPKNQLK